VYVVEGRTLKAHTTLPDPIKLDVAYVTPSTGTPTVLVALLLITTMSEISSSSGVVNVRYALLEDGTTGASGDVITRLPVPLIETATNIPLPYARETQELVAAALCDVQVIPSGDVMTRSPIPSNATTTNNPLP
jgi:hypothetical protein